ncbi:MAG TPA: ABC transporter ATP-binding protein [Blastocatellia bacterium]|nr:ABC transporter ATP-binding protein [Blastocatellia bacterium]
MAAETRYTVELRGISKRFGAVQANDHVDISVPAGTIHAIIGENGAGKSTAMKILYGFYTADSGQILINGQSHSIKNSRAAIDAGLGMVHQHFMLVDRLTVAENIILGHEPVSAAGLDYQRARAEVRDISERYGLKIDPDAVVADLSVGQHQRVEILKTLYRGAEILILDEPTAVLTPQEIEGLFEVLRALRGQGKTIIIITHKLWEVLAISDNITVMRNGCVVGNLPTPEATAEELAKLMVGREVLLRVDKSKAIPKETVLSVRSLCFKDAEGYPVLADISFDVRAGEILAVAGVEGNGQTELIEVLAGLRQPASGDILFGEKSIKGLGVGRRKQLGIAHIPEDRLRRGLLLPLDLAENSILGMLDPPATWGVLLDRKRIEQRARRLVAEFDVRPADIAASAKALSGGNQQKLIIAREFDINPKLLLVAQPTRGVDIGATEFIHRKLVELRDRGTAILLVSAELDEVLSLGDRVVVIFEGRIAGEADPTVADREQIGLMMTGGGALHNTDAAGRD